MRQKTTNRRLTLEHQKMIVDNIGLVHYLVKNNFSVVPYSSDYDELVSIGQLGLIKAVLAFDEKKGYIFPKFAIPCILNEIRMYFRKNYKYMKNRHLEDVIVSESDHEEITLKETLEDKRANFEEEFIKNQDFIEVIDIILNYFNQKETLLLIYWVSGFNQKRIGEILNISQSSVSRLEKKLQQELYSTIKNNIRYRKKCYITKTEVSYDITFLVENVCNWNSILYEIHKKIKKDDLKHFIIVCNNSNITIKILGSLEYFFILAQIFEIIYKYDETF